MTVVPQCQVALLLASVSATSAANLRACAADAWDGISAFAVGGAYSYAGCMAVDTAGRLLGALRPKPTLTHGKLERSKTQDADVTGISGRWILDPKRSESLDLVFS